MKKPFMIANILISLLTGYMIESIFSIFILKSTLGNYIRILIDVLQKRNENKTYHL